MQTFETGPDGITWRGGGQTLVVQAWGANAVRVRCAPGDDVVDTDFALLPAAPADVAITTDGGEARLVVGGLTAVLRAWDFYDEQVGYRVYRCAVEFRDAAGKVLLRELDAGGSLKLDARAFRPIAGGDHQLTAAFEPVPGERLSGMGQYQQQILDLKGSTFELAHRNSQASVPFVVSSAGYGFLWHNPAIGRATFAANRTEWVAEQAKQLDYWITAGDTPAAIAAAYADATGHAPMMPEYGLGYWQCKLRYWNQEQLLDVVREHKRRGLPMDVIVADFFHWPRMGDFRFEEEFWPDPRAMVDELRDLGIELMVSVWPQVSTESENFAAFRKENLLVRTERGLEVQMGFQGPSMFLDVTNPRTRDAVWQIIRRNYHDRGIKLFWLDEAEPEYGVYDFDNYRYHQGSNLQVGNIYPQAFARAFHEGQTAAGQSQVVNLLRCAWAGSQRYGALVWSGDIHSTYEDLRRQITAGIHMGVAGIPWFTTDIGGFHDGDITDPDFHDLLIRWFQFGTFCPVMRMHGDRRPYEDVVAADGTPRLRSGAPNELWSFGEDVYEILARYVRLRETLRPYTRRLMEEAHLAGQPVMRGMFHEFPADEACWDVPDQYMYGPDLLVAPVVEPHATGRAVYLPAGSWWTDLHSGEKTQGGRWVTVAAERDVIPVFARDDALPELVGTI
ncbi:TIM-barrel domain-containing protein [Myceligenerans pegani]|uniref:Family 31 glucosidase n=1 Tax=Myceligenerans pegani TaxID=2776917 RepID=A0ABR9MYH1_9MICO|nr:TIM-barrel domain-containing protein [Myceligenerans sp. TRM 65318]MBE1876424.1 family 31 glucosidase [Myceligenerans sp. TRM 65318]MBE3018695.1 family 31 glucosidase [Myceligenerans sp. TRM 65318]